MHLTPDVRERLAADVGNHCSHSGDIVPNTMTGCADCQLIIEAVFRTVDDLLYEQHPIPEIPAEADEEKAAIANLLEGTPIPEPPLSDHEKMKRTLLRGPIIAHFIRETEEGKDTWARTRSVGKIQAIKEARTITQLGLKDAKEIIEELETEAIRRYHDKYPPF